MSIPIEGRTNSLDSPQPRSTGHPVDPGPAPEITLSPRQGTAPEKPLFTPAPPRYGGRTLKITLSGNQAAEREQARAQPRGARRGGS